MQIIYDDRSCRMQYRKPYGFWKFIGDIIMTCITCGFWIIWIFVREMRNR